MRDLLFEQTPKTLRPHQSRAIEIDLLARGWRRIAEFPRYLVSDAGSVFSTIRAGRHLKPFIINTGYEALSLMPDGASRPVKVLVHRIVAAAFCDGSGEVVNHKDGNKRNNHASNLEWCSYSENNDHARDTGLTANFGSRHYAAKLSDEDVIQIRKRVACGVLQRDVAEEYGVTRRAIGKIASGVAWRRVV